MKTKKPPHLRLGEIREETREYWREAEMTIEAMAAQVQHCERDNERLESLRAEWAGLGERLMVRRLLYRNAMDVVIPCPGFTI